VFGQRAADGLGEWGWRGLLDQLLSRAISKVLRACTRARQALTS
jgi:hypothetical protein